MSVYGSMIDIVNEELGNQIFKEFDEIVTESISISSVVDKIKQLLKKFKEFVKKMIAKFISLIKKDKKSISDFQSEYAEKSLLKIEKVKSQKSEEPDKSQKSEQKIDLYNMKFDEIEISYYEFYDDIIDSLFDFRSIIMISQNVDTEEDTIRETEQNNRFVKVLNKMNDGYSNFDPESYLKSETISSYSAYEKLRSRLLNVTKNCSSYVDDMNGVLEYFLRLSTDSVNRIEKAISKIEQSNYDSQIVSDYLASARNIVQSFNKSTNVFGSACSKFSKAIRYNMNSLTTLTNHFIKMTKSQEN